VQDRETVSESSLPGAEEENSENEEEFTEEAISQVDTSHGTSMTKKKAVSYENKLLARTSGRACILSSQMCVCGANGQRAIEVLFI
jgi:hypothetical protein